VGGWDPRAGLRNPLSNRTGVGQRASKTFSKAGRASKRSGVVGGENEGMEAEVREESEEVVVTSKEGYVPERLSRHKDHTLFASIVPSYAETHNVCSSDSLFAVAFDTVPSVSARHRFISPHPAKTGLTGCSSGRARVNDTPEWWEWYSKPIGRT